MIKRKLRLDKELVAMNGVDIPYGGRSELDPNCTGTCYTNDFLCTYFCTLDCATGACPTNAATCKHKEY